MNQNTAEILQPSPILAMVNGAPLNKLPDDLYIPPDALEVLLDTFEGPLDLLLYLIRRQNLDVVNIPIAKITHQYIAYIQIMGVLLAFLLVAGAIAGPVIIEGLDVFSTQADKAVLKALMVPSAG